MASERTPSEHLEQVTLVNELRKKYPLTHAISNGGYRTKTTAKRLKEEGVLAGVPDLFIPELALYIELKRTKGGLVSPQQKRKHKVDTTVLEDVIGPNVSHLHKGKIDNG